MANIKELFEKAETALREINSRELSHDERKRFVQVVEQVRERLAIQVATLLSAVGALGVRETGMGWRLQPRYAEWHICFDRDPHHTYDAKGLAAEPEMYWVVARALVEIIDKTITRARETGKEFERLSQRVLGTQG